MRRFRTIILTGLMAVTLPLALSAAQSPQTNLDRLQQCARLIGDSILAQMSQVPEICLRVVDHPAGFLLDGGILQAASASSVTVVDCAPPYSNEVLAAVTGSSVSYVPIGGDRRRRDVRMKVSASVPVELRPGSARTRRSVSHEVVLSDTIDVGEIDLVEDSAYDFILGSELESASGSIWKSLVEPAVVLGASVVMVILLFTARSG